jgi:hypothetical protein
VATVRKRRSDPAVKGGLQGWSKEPGEPGGILTEYSTVPVNERRVPLVRNRCLIIPICFLGKDTGSTRKIPGIIPTVHVL